MKVEVCVTSVDAAIIAERAGADRLELCCELAVGGITPSVGLLERAREVVGIPIHVLIRPRSGDFTYSEHTFSQMLRDIAFCRQLGYEGIVTGCLHGDNRLDTDRMEVLAEACADLHLTFHRAFDRIPNWKQALTELEVLGVDTILTSGQATSAAQGLSRLEELVQTARCGIMPGGGIRPGILQYFMGKGFEAVHLSALGAWPSETPSVVPLNSPQLLREGAPLLPEEGVIQEVVNRVRGT
jgi:copper homeostasis protein